MVVSVAAVCGCFSWTSPFNIVVEESSSLSSTATDSLTALQADAQEASSSFAACVAGSFTDAIASSGAEDLAAVEVANAGWIVSSSCSGKSNSGGMYEAAKYDSSSSSNKIEGGVCWDENNRLLLDLKEEELIALRLAEAE